MRLYHVNPETGIASICRAQKACRFGETSPHYPSKEAAQEDFERNMKEHTVRTHTAGRRQSTVGDVLLSDVMDTALLQRMIQGGLIQTQTHPDDASLKVMTYTKTAQVTGRWNDATKQARGLIFRSLNDDFSDAVILEKPWKKFFTLQQMTGSDGSTAWALGDEEDGPQDHALASIDNLDFNAPAEVTDKMDGSLGILYQAPDGKLAIATKGSFASDQAIAYTKLLRENPKYYDAAEKLKKDNPNVTFLFELVGRDNQIVLEYTEDDITFTGAVEKDTGMYRSTKDFASVWSEEKGLHSAEFMEASNMAEALAIPDRPNREGVVVRVLSDDPAKQMQVKIKQADYIRLHRLLSSVSKKGVRSTVRESKGTIGDLIAIGRTGEIRRLDKVREAMEFFENGGSPLHVKLRDEQEANFTRAIMPKAATLAKAYDTIMGYSEKHFEGNPKVLMKDFALSVSQKDPSERAALLQFYGARVRGEDVLEKTAASILRGMASDFE